MSTNPLQRLLAPSGLVTFAGLGLCLLLIAVMGLGPMDNPSILADSVNSAGHFFVFGLLALLLAVTADLVLPPHKTPGWLPLATGFVLAVGAGLFLELVQRLIPGRNSSLSDLWQDTLGALAGICLLRLLHFPRSDRSAARGVRWMSLALLVSATILGCAPLASCLADYRDRDRAFPRLVDFHASWPQRFVKLDEAVQLTRTTPPPQWPADAGKNVARLQIGTGTRFAGWAMKEPYPKWPAEADLVFDVYLVSHETLPLALRIHDAKHDNDYHDRFNCTLNLRHGYQQIRIPVREIRDGPRARELDLMNITNFKLFTIDLTQPAELIVGNLRLEMDS